MVVLSAGTLEITRKMLGCFRESRRLTNIAGIVAFDLWVMLQDDLIESNHLRVCGCVSFWKMARTRHHPMRGVSVRLEV